MAHRRALLAIAYRLHARGRDAKRHQHVLDRLSPTLTQGQIVFARTAFVGMALDGDRDIRIALQPLGLTLQDLLRLGRDVDPVVFEEHAVAGRLRQILLRARPEPRRADAARSTGTDAARTTLRRGAAAGGERGNHAGNGYDTYEHDEAPPRRIGVEVPDGGPIQAIARRKTPGPLGPANGGGLYRHDLSKQGRPGRIGRVAWGFHLTLVASGQVDRKEARRGTAALAEIHQHPAVRRPGRSFDEKILCQQPFARAVRTHHADIERTSLDLGKGDQVATWRPYRGAVFARAETDPLGIAAFPAHPIKLLRSTAVRVE